MTYLNLSILFLLVLAASSCGQELSINPPTASSLLLEGDQFRRVCLLNNRPSWVSRVSLRWLLNGTVLASDESSSGQFELSVSAATVNDSGTYVCEATIFAEADTSSQTITSSEKTITVLSREPLLVPSEQVGEEGRDFSLTCSYHDVQGTWLDGVSGTFSPLRVDNEGTYSCLLIIFHGLSSVSVTKEVTLRVEVPVRIVSSTSPVHQELAQNRPLSLSVSFTGRITHNLTVTWYHNGTAISTHDSRINTVLNFNGISTSTLSFSPARRADKGIYHVEVVSVVGENLPRSDNRTFQVNVRVDPSHPAGLAVTQVSSTTARAMWQLTNTTEDSGPHTLELHLTYTRNRSHADTIRLPGYLTSHLLEGLAPATNYTMQVAAINPDGMASSSTHSFTTREGHPLLNSVTASHVNSTHISILAEVAYTGGGVIQTIRVVYGPGLIRNLQEVETVGALQYRTLLEMEEASDEALVLRVSLINQHDFVSRDTEVTVLPYEAITKPSTEHPSTSPSNTPIISSLPLPLWLMAIVVVVGIVVVGVVIMACVVLVCCKCRRSKKRSLPVSALNKDALDVEKGRKENMYSPGHSSTEEFRSQTGSLVSSTRGRSPSLDKIHHHKREPSDCSSSNISIAKPNFSTPTTTASNSPSNLIKTGGYASQDQGLGMIMEMEPISHSSEDSCPESDRDRRLHQMKCEEEMDRDKNLINAELHRAPGDGSPCDSHQSLLAPAGSNLMISASNPTLLSFNPKVAHSDSRLYNHTPLPRMDTPCHEYMYSDCTSVASTEISVGNHSLPPHNYPAQHHYHVHHPSRHPCSYTPKHALNTSYTASLKSVQGRTATPFNHEGVGSMV